MRGEDRERRDGGRGGYEERGEESDEERRKQK